MCAPLPSTAMVGLSVYRSVVSAGLSHSAAGADEMVPSVTDGARVLAPLYPVTRAPWRQLALSSRARRTETFITLSLSGGSRMI
ncbi:Hypothetical protein SMAX5B_014766 [Scophthalmus maximus]|uniref:Uncharacterized protein n=1 Tax=Scophthalmus maximus TaxID=52904 RepID=A0A2U9BZL8_SCOMX|nr:Hypothetical protein SMAX5B_014766 [Scophthalmus maximus]